MIRGIVTADRVPVIHVEVGGIDWPAIIDTGFNGDVELPEALRHSTNPRFLCRMRSRLAGGQSLEEDCFLVDFPFDGTTTTIEATFVPDDHILIGTRLLSGYRLVVDFVRRDVLIDRAVSGPSDN